MFRKPMGLEQWKACDGAFGADAVEVAQDARAEGDGAGGASAALAEEGMALWNPNGPFASPMISAGDGGPAASSEGGKAGRDAGWERIDSGGAESVTGGGGGDTLSLLLREDEDVHGPGAHDAADGSGVEEVAVAASLAIDAAPQDAPAAEVVFDPVRNFQAIMLAVGADRSRLEDALALLGEEYHRRDPAEWGDLREPLRRIFDTGGREMEAINRTLTEMRSRMRDCQSLAVEQRDGMMPESIRGLGNAASRRSGETAALAEAVHAVVGLLREHRLAGAGLPSPAAIAMAFYNTHDEAITAWLARAARDDPMGGERGCFTIPAREEG